jgi:hypothetical protein
MNGRQLTADAVQQSPTRWQAALRDTATLAVIWQGDRIHRTKRAARAEAAAKLAGAA